jgi:hypothetical protein
VLHANERYISPPPINYSIAGFLFIIKPAMQLYFELTTRHMPIDDANMTACTQGVWYSKMHGWLQFRIPHFIKH